MEYSPSDIAGYFDEYGMREWERLTATPLDEISLHVHTHYLKKFILPNSHVLEIGAGAGRFSQILAEITSRLVVADISPGQLALNRKLAGEFGYVSSIEGWFEADICDLSQFEPGSFDVVVAYGGPFSYVLDRRDQAMAACWRVLADGGVLLCSVMCLWGTAHRTLNNVLSLPSETNKAIISSGDLRSATYPGRNRNFMHLFRSDELCQCLERNGFQVLRLSASGCLATHWDELLAEIRKDVEKWKELLDLELEASAEPGCLDMGTHLIALAQKRLGESKV
jgi:SAM-dependent methyltransferase